MRGSSQGGSQRLDGGHRGQKKLTEITRSSQRTDGPHRGQTEVTEVRGSTQRSEEAHRGQREVLGISQNERELILSGLFERPLTSLSSI